MPRKKYVPTEKDRGTVKAMASYGVPQVDIGRVIGCSHVTLRRAFSQELAVAEITANAKVAETLYSCATNPDPRHNAARFFWLKTRAGWRETTDHRFVDGEGKDRPLDITTARSLIRNWKPEQVGKS